MKKNVLIVDMLGKTKIEISNYLKKYNIEIIHVKDEFEVLGRLKESRSNIKLVVWCIYSENNYEFETAKKLKNIEAFENIPLAIISIYNEKKYVFKAIEAGAVEYIVRPFTEELIVKKINELIGLTTVNNKLNYKENEGYEEDDKIILSLKEILSINLKSAIRGKYPLSILMLALINTTDNNDIDTREVISIIIKLLKTKLRETDVIIKYGMDNILVILPFADSNGVRIVHEKLKSALYSNSFLNEKGRGHVLNSSFVTYPENGKYQEQLLSKLQANLEPIVVFLEPNM